MKVTLGLFVGILCVMLAAQADPRMWGEHGIPIRQGMHLKWYQGMARDENGNTLLVWSEKSTGQRDIRAQLVNSSGQPQWVAEGVNVTPEPRFQDSPVAVAVNGGWIVAWVDFRDTTGCDYYWDYYTCASVFAQKLDYSGNRLWPDNDFTGAMVNPSVDGFDKSSLRIVSDAAGGAIIAWREWGMGYGIHAQRVTANGDPAWPESVQIPDSNYIGETKVAPGPDGSMLMAWTSYEEAGVHAARILPDGTLPWGASGVPITGNWYVSSPDVVSDGGNGCYVTWADLRSEVANQIYAQRLTGDGERMWAENGVAISAEGQEANFPGLTLSTTGGDADGMVTAWAQQEQENQYAVYAQKISPEGAAAWTVGGVELSSLVTNYWQANIAVTTDYNGGLVAVWQDNSGTVPHCWAARVRWNGSLAWGTNPVPACDPLSPSANSYYQTPLFEIAGNFGTYFLGYVGVDSLGMEGVRCQLLDHASGARLLGPNGIAAVSGIGGDANLALVAPMSDQRTVVFWTDGRFANYSWSGPLYYQIVGADGQMQRAANGERLVPNNTDNPYAVQYSPQTCDDGAGGLFVSYVDYRSSISLISVSHLDPSGDVVGPDSGMIVWWQPGMLDQQSAFICPDGQAGCYVAWTGYNPDYSEDAYVMRLNADLQRVWNQPVQLTDTLAEGYLSALVANSDDCCMAFLISGASNDRNIVAAGVCGDGTVAWHDTICNAAGNQTGLVAISDGAAGAYVVWIDLRTPQNGWDLYAQRIAGDGTPDWSANGVPVYTGTANQSDPQITLDSGGNLCVVWEDEQNGDRRVYAQRLSLQGTRLWNENGVRVNSTYTYSPQVAASSRAGIFALWGSYSPNMFATHLDSTGAIFDDPFWRPDTGGVVAEPVDEHELAYSMSAVSDGWGGCVAGWIKWEDEYEYFPDRGGELYTSDVYAQRLLDYPNSARGRDDALPGDYALDQNYPNPFNPITEIHFDLPEAVRVELKVFNILGQDVATLVDAVRPAGSYTVQWDSRCTSGTTVSSGVYVYQLKAGKFTDSKKMVLLR